MRKLGIVVFVVAGLYLIIKLLATISFGFSYMFFSDATLPSILVTAITTIVFLAVGVLLVTNAKRLSEKVFPDEGLSLSISAQELLRVILIAVAFTYGLSQLLSVFGQTSMLFDPDWGGIPFDVLLAPALGVVASGLIIYFSAQISKFFLADRSKKNKKNDAAGI